MVDAAVVGSGPNGLSAAIALARAGLTVRVPEAQPTVGGGTRSAGLTLPGFVHDVCSAIHPMAAASPFFAGLDLAKHGLEWIHPEIAVAHPLDDGTAVALVRSTAINDCMARLAQAHGLRYPGVAGDDNPILDVIWQQIRAHG
jgi:phytoene dehydrogenase-like protein